MDQMTCETCEYFRQHYALDKKKIFRVCCGHCTFARPVKKTQYTKACANYRQGKKDEDSFPSKEYLSKELLQYMMKLELLPEIQQLPEAGKLKNPG